MKLISAIILAALCIAVPAYAYDLAYLGPIKAKETKSINVSLPDGKSRVDVSSSSETTKFNCKFQTSSYGGVVLEQNNTAKCSILPVVKSDTQIVVTLTNLGNDSDYKIWVHDAE